MKCPESRAEVCSPRINVGRVWRWGRGGILSPQPPARGVCLGPGVLPGCAVWWPLASCGRSSLIFSKLKGYKRKHSGSRSHLPHSKHSVATCGRGLCPAQTYSIHFLIAGSPLGCAAPGLWSQTAPASPSCAGAGGPGSRWAAAGRLWLALHRAARPPQGARIFHGGISSGPVSTAKDHPSGYGRFGLWAPHPHPAPGVSSTS